MSEQALKSALPTLQLVAQFCFIYFWNWKKLESYWRTYISQMKHLNPYPAVKVHGSSQDDLNRAIDSLRRKVQIAGTFKKLRDDHFFKSKTEKRKKKSYRAESKRRQVEKRRAVR